MSTSNEPVGRATLLGIAIAFGLAIAAKLASASLGALLLPGKATAISPVLCAIVLGVAWRNLVGINARWEPGLEWIVQRLLRVGIALVGLRLTLEGVASAGITAVIVVVCCLIVALTASALLGRLLGLPPSLRQLIALGTGVCGCTAIVSVAPLIRARPAETGLALSCVVVLGCLGMLLYPWIAHLLFSGNSTAAGIFLGTAIHDTSQVMGASFIYAQQFNGAAAVPIAGFTKLMRNLSLLLLAPLAVAWANSAAPPERVKAHAGILRRAQVLPTFLIWFIVMAIVRMLGDRVLAGHYATQWNWSVNAALTISELLLVYGMTAVGLSVSLRDIYAIGWRAFVAALGVAILVGACSLTLLIFLHPT